MEFVVAKVQGGVNRLKRFEVDVNLSLLSFGGNNFTAVDNEAIWRNLVVELETLLGGGNRGKDGQTVDTRLDVGSGTLASYTLISPFKRTVAG